MDLLAALDEMLGRIDVAAGVQPHVDAAHDLAGAAGGVEVLDDLDLELHVALEARRRPHVEVAGVELEADVDELSLHGVS